MAENEDLTSRMERYLRACIFGGAEGLPYPTSRAEKYLAALAGKIAELENAIPSNSDLIEEGNTNKYYTDARAAEKADNPTLNTTGDIELANNTIYRRGELSAITFPAIMPEPTHISIVEFTSGETPTTVTDASGAKWTGDSVVFSDDAYAFVPLANMRYNISFTYDGEYLVACVVGVSV